jgi:phage-related protein
VREHLLSLPEDARVEVLAAMKDVRENGLEVARHVQGEIYEVRASHNKVEYRILFATEGSRSQVLLSLESFHKKTRRTPPDRIDVALDRLRDWRSRARTHGRRIPK